MPAPSNRFMRVPVRFGGFKMDFQGGDAILKRLNKFTDDMQKKIVQEATRKAMKPVLAATKATSPKDTGKMAAAFKLLNIKRNKKHPFRRGVRIVTGTRAKLGIPAKSPYYYPAAVELGTKHVDGERFMRNTLLENASLVFNFFAKEMRNSMFKALIKHGKGALK